MTSALYTFAGFLLLGGLWAFTQSPAGTQFPIPIAVGGAVMLAMLWFR